MQNLLWLKKSFFLFFSGIKNVNGNHFSSMLTDNRQQSESDHLLYPSSDLEQTLQHCVLLSSCLAL